MTIKEFVEKAIEGGWNKRPIPMLLENVGTARNPNMKTSYSIELIALDPNAWRAVGKVMSWKEKIPHIYFGRTREVPEWQHNMHQMLDALIEGKSVEDYIKTL